jgi:hypothetical protein
MNLGFGFGENFRICKNCFNPLFRDAKPKHLLHFNLSYGLGLDNLGLNRSWLELRKNMLDLNRI